MSMSTGITGYRPKDAEWEKKKSAFQACQDAGIPIPEKLYEFFNGCDPVKEDLHSLEIPIEQAVRQVKGVDMRNIWEVDITKLPAGVRFIRFINSY